MLKKYINSKNVTDPLINYANFNRFRENINLGTTYGFHIIDIMNNPRESSSQIFFSHLFQNQNQNPSNLEEDEDLDDEDDEVIAPEKNGMENLIDSFFQMSDSEEFGQSPNVSLAISTHVSVASLIKNKTEEKDKNKKSNVQKSPKNGSFELKLASDIVNWSNCGGISIVEQFDRSNIFALGS